MPLCLQKYVDMFLATKITASGFRGQGLIVSDLVVGALLLGLKGFINIRGSCQGLWPYCQGLECYYEWLEHAFYGLGPYHGGSQIVNFGHEFF